MASTSSNSEEEVVLLPDSDSDVSVIEISEDEKESIPEGGGEGTPMVTSSGSNWASSGTSITSDNTETDEPNTTAAVTPQEDFIASGSRKRVKLEDSRQDTILKDVLECNICHGFPASPVYSCLNGHVTCGSCYRKLPNNKQCGLCQTDLHVSPFAEKVVEKMDVKIKCENNVRGCQDMVNSTDMVQHLKVCYYRDILCYASLSSGTNSKCSGLKISGSEEFVSHQKDVHGVESLTYDSIACKVDFTIEVIPNGHLVSSGDGMKIICIGEKHVFLQTYETAEFLNIWFTLFGDKKEASKYEYNLKLMSMDNLEKKITITWKCPVLPYWDNPSPNSGCRVPSFSPCIPISTFTEFGKKDKNKTVCKFSLEINDV